MPDLNAFGRCLQVLLCHVQGHRAETDVERLRMALAALEAPTADDAEAGVRALGEALGFTSTRPDNDEGTGPDVLWRDEATKQYLGLELKTEKKTPATYHKKDVGQGHNHIAWMKERYSDYSSLGMFFVGPDGEAHEKASPSPEMSLCTVERLASLRDRLMALIEDLMRRTPIERLAMVSKETADPRWTLQSVAKRLRTKSLVAR